MNDFKGKTAVVTGAASGIGKALVEHAASLDMRVVAADIDIERAQAVAATAGDSVVAHAVDVADPESVEALAQAVQADHGGVDLLVNNAGVFQGGVMWERSLEDWRWTLDVNLWGIIHAVKSFVPAMVEQGSGHIVNTASVAAFVAGQFSSPYVVSKCAAFSITECLALDLASSGSAVGVSVLCPSSIDTGIAKTDRVRQDRYGSTAGDDAAFVSDALGSMLAGSLDPSEVAAITFDGIAAGDFLIATKPSYRTQLTSRFEALTERRLPPVPAVD